MGQSKEPYMLLQEMHLQAKMLRDMVKLYNRLADIAADLLSRYLEFASKERNQQNSIEKIFPIQKTSLHPAAEVIKYSD